MFYGDQAIGLLETAGTSGHNNSKKVIRIPDLAPIGFENLLRYAYTDSLNLNSVEDAMLTAYAAKKYLLPHLLRECLSFVDKNVAPSSACSVLEFSVALSCHALTWQALQVIDRQTYQVLGHKSWTGIQAATLATIAARPYLNLFSEASLVNAALAWAAAEAKRRSLDPRDHAGVLRELLQEAGVLPRLRLLALPPDDLAKIIVATTNQRHGLEDEEEENCSGLLSRSEQVAVFMNIAVPGIRRMPASLSPESRIRSAPPDHFVVARFPTNGSHVLATATPLSLTTAAGGDKSGCGVKAAACRFQVNELPAAVVAGSSSDGSLLFLVGAVIPIRLDPSFYSVRSPRLDVVVTFTSRPGIMSSSSDTTGGRSEEPVTMIGSAAAGDGGMTGGESHSVSASLSKDKDCVLRFRKPLVVRTGNLNEVTVCLSGTHLHSQDLVVVRSRVAAAGATGAGGSRSCHNRSTQPANASGNQVTDAEGVTWLFFKPSSGSSSAGVEFTELFYYF